MSMKYFALPQYILIGALLSFSISFWACESKEEKAQKEELSKAQAIDLFYGPNAELLAIKYGIEEEKVLSLILEEDPMFGTLDTLSDEGFIDLIFGKNIGKRIARYSQKYGLPKQVIANILIDYKAMSCD